MIGIGINTTLRAGTSSGVSLPVAITATGVGETSFTANWNPYPGAVYYLLDVSTSSSFSTFVYQDQYTTSTSYVVIGLSANTTYYYRFRANTEYDVDAQAFFDRVTNAGGTLTTTEKNAVNTLVGRMKIAGIWTSMKAIYPMVGASAAACAQNLKSASFTGSFTPGWTFTSTGVTGNGTSAYFNTNFNQSSNLTPSNNHISLYSRTDVDAVVVDCGITNNVTYSFSQLLLRSGGNATFENGSQKITPSTANSLGLYTGSALTAGIKLYKNGSSISSSTAAQTRSMYNNNIYIAATNESTSNNPFYFTSRQYAFSSIGDGLTDTEASNLYTAVQEFQTTLSRNIGPQIVNDPDAQTYINRVYSAGGTLTNAEANAANQLVQDLKSLGIWNKIYALYPMLGSSSAACGQNLRSSSFTASFSPGWTFTPTGVTGNGVSTYMDTTFNPSLHFLDFNNGASIYSRSDVSDESYDYGITKTGGIGHNVYLNYSGVGMRWHLQCTFGQRPQTTPTGSTGFFTGVTGASNDRRMYKNGSLLASDTQTSTTTLAQLNDTLPLGAQKSDGTFGNHSQRQYALFALHQNLTAGEVSNFNTANSTFQTTLSR